MAEPRECCQEKARQHAMRQPGQCQRDGGLLLWDREGHGPERRTASSVPSADRLSRRTTVSSCCLLGPPVRRWEMMDGWASADHALGARATRTLTAMANAAIPPHGSLPPVGAAAVARLTALLGEYGAVAAYRNLLWALEIGTVATRGRRFSRLDREAQTAVLGRLAADAAPWSRGLARGLLMPLKAAYVDGLAVHEAIGCRYGVAPATGLERPRWRERIMDGRNCRDDDAIECDVAIVGSGAGGAVVAHHLAAAGHAVVIIEAGAHFAREHFNGQPLAMTRAMFLNRGLTFALGNVGAPVWAGRTVGGSTTINSGTCYRTPGRILRRWQREYGLEMLTESALAPYFERIERTLGVAPADPRYLGEVAAKIALGAEALGLRHQALARNAPDCDGQGLCCFGCPTGAKRSTDVSFVPQALERGALLYASTRVIRVDHDGRRASGVTARCEGGATITVRARKTVLAAGALLSPGLLHGSGIARRNRWLGRNLSIHPAGAATATFSEPIDMGEGIPQGYSIDEYAERGLLFEGGALPLSAYAASVPGVGSDFTSAIANYRRTALFGFVIEDRSRGRLVFRRGASGGGRELPLIFYNLCASDTRRMQEATATLAEVFLAAGAETVFPGYLGAAPIRNGGDVAALRASTIAPAAFEVSAYHPLGTARMSCTDRDGVVGPDHQVHGMGDLHVVDGSAVPSALGVNPQITIMGLALRAADILDRRLSFGDAAGADDPSEEGTR